MTAGSRVTVGWAKSGRTNSKGAQQRNMRVLSMPGAAQFSLARSHLHVKRAAPHDFPYDRQVSDLGIPYLKSYWDHAMNPSGGSREWVRDNTMLSALRLGIQETGLFLQTNRPSFEEFERWVLERNDGSINPERVAR